MSGILTPGYLRWDGTKYVLDHDVEIVGPAGSAGPVGPAGPAGPPGPFGTASGDILGTYPGPISVVGLTGISGIVNFGGAILNPTITQTSTGSTTGQPFTLKGQNAALFGGNIIIQSGTGTTAGIVEFMVGSNVAGFFDSSLALRIGPNASSTVTGPNGVAPVSGTDYIYGYNVNGSMWIELMSGATAQRGAIGVYNTAAGGVGVNGISIQGPGSAFGVGSYQGQGVIEQSGTTTSAMVFSKIQGNGTGRAISGRIWQTGAWAIGDAANNNTSTLAQAGLSGTMINLSGFGGGTLTSTSNQVTIFNSYSSFPTTGVLNLQAHVGTNFISNLTTIASTSTTKFITNQGRTLKLRTTTTSPVTIATTDEYISIGTISSVSTTIAAASNGQALPQGTINVAATASFPTSGAIYVTTTNGPQIVTYTNTTGTSFTGCTGGTGVMSTGGAVVSIFTVNLPAGPATGDIYIVKDANGSANFNNIIVLGNGANIDGQTNTLITTNFTQATYVYNGTTWISSLANNLIPNGFSSTVNVASGGSAIVVGFDELIMCDPTSNSCTVTAPASPLTNLRFTVKDATSQATPLRPIIINGNGRLLEDPSNPGFYAATINITAAARSVTWAYDPTRNRFMVV